MNSHGVNSHDVNSYVQEERAGMNEPALIGLTLNVQREHLERVRSLVKDWHDEYNAVKLMGNSDGGGELHTWIGVLLYPSTTIATIRSLLELLEPYALPDTLRFSRVNTEEHGKREVV